MSTKIKLRTKVMARSRRALTFLQTTNNLPSGAIPKKSFKQQGFTLIELLVVVSILAALAGLTSVAMDGYQQDSEEKLTRVEMQRISNAIRRFKADTGYWPKMGLFEYSPTTPTSLKSYHDDYYANAIDFSWLFYPPTKHIAGKKFSGSWVDDDTEISKWQIESSIGWNGPYIDIPAAKEIVAGTDCQNFNDTEMTALLSEPSGYPSSMKRRSIGIIDRFERNWQKTKTNTYCVTTRHQDDFNQYIPDVISGSPYLYETDYTDTGSCSGGCIAIRSLGKDSSDSNDDDDIVFVLKVK